MASFTFKANFIKSKVVLSTLLSRYGELTPMSDTSFKSLCFFHNDIRPSMQINDLPANSPYYYCHSCGANGDFIKFLSKKAKVSNGRVLQDVYSVLSSGGSFLTWLEEFEKTHGIEPFQRSLVPRASLGTRLRAKGIVKDKERENHEAAAEKEAELARLKYDSDKVLNTLAQAKEFYTTRLVMDPHAYFVRSYLENRGISVATAMKFELGYAPTIRLLKSKPTENTNTADASATGNPPKLIEKPKLEVSRSILKQTVGDSLVQWNNMRNKTLTNWMLHGLSEQDIINDRLEYLVHGGLTINSSVYNTVANAGTKKDGYYDRFRNRLMIPIRNEDGKVIGFGGRELPLPRNLMTEDELKELERRQKNVAKYINSPSSVVFSKKKTLFGIDVAKAHSEKEGYVILVEGYFDVISLYEAGVKNVVASMGTAVTLEQLLMGANLTKSRTIVMMLDNDDAGKAAALRAKKIADKHNDKMRRMTRPDGDLLDDYCIVLKKASIDDSLAFIETHDILTKDKVSYSPDKKLKDCADICELFVAANARRIIKHIVKKAKDIEDDAIETDVAESKARKSEKAEIISEDTKKGEVRQPTTTTTNAAAEATANSISTSVVAEKEANEDDERLTYDQLV